MSRTTARPSTGPAQAPKACSRRATTSVVMESASAHTTEDSTKTSMPHSITGRRPKRSDSGPTSNCPAPKPSR